LLVETLLVVGGILALCTWLAGAVCRRKVRLDGKTVLITGDNTGVGKETALDMAKRGEVIPARRDLSRAQIAADEIRQQSGKGNVAVKKMDHASLQSVKELAKDVQENDLSHLSVFVDLEIMTCPKWRTEDGFEMQFDVNHLGRFFLTNSLLHMPKKSGPSRVVVSSMEHEKGYIHFDDINLDKDYKRMRSYSQSKLANVLFCRELAARLQCTGVTVYSLHPGIIQKELTRPLMPTVTTIYCLANTSGLHYSNLIWGQIMTTDTVHCFMLFSSVIHDCAPKTPAPQGLDDAAAKKLWDLSASMVGLA
uniref:Uncharacterized protein n=1 Tax=Mola mola TaxID=94237 RepID=A0A3Q3VVN6_MOLML